MEAPPPPPGMTYNEFRTWRKERGIRATREELAEAWRVYSTTSTTRSSPPRRSPTRTSPRRSPVRYGGLSNASLVGLPPDVQRMVLPGLGRAAIGALRVASKGTSRLTETQMARICSEPVTLDELIKALPRIELPAGFELDVINVQRGVKKSDPRNARKPEGTLKLVRRPHPSKVIVVPKALEGKLKTKREMFGGHHLTLERALAFLRSIDVPRDRLVISLAPPTLKQVLGLRLSCLKADPGVPSREARRSLLASVSRLFHPRGMVRVRVIGRQRASVLTETDLMGDDIVIALPVRDVIRRVAAMHRIATKAIEETNRLTLGYQHVPFTDWNGLTEEEVYDRYVEVINQQFERLKELYRSL